jgi:serine/threonine protein kinase
MEADRWERIEQLCQAALERDEAQQTAFLEAACGADHDLRREVESLLAHRRRAENFLETPAMQIAARALALENSSRAGDASRLVGRLVSHYRIVEKVASGGMGDVFRAVRADGTYDKQVAIKFIQGARSTEFFLARFQNERQILADLDHPNIARLLDGGTTEQGLPYLVMEFIEGLPIDEFCTQKGLNVHERLALFRTVCSAVQFPHQNLVVHRDLKPRNILVTPDGVPKLLDFGVAKILSPQRSEETSPQTVTLMRMLTPDYASPEQVRNGPISTSSDVYSLGVIVYVLLTGQSPYRASADSPQEMMKAIFDTEPEKPSTVAMRASIPEGSVNKHVRASQETRPLKEAKLEKLSKVLAGDVDNIVLKALRKDPQRRYSSVEQFSEDIRRYLSGLPVLAHKDTLRYRSRKFIGRHKVGVAAAALLVLSLAGGMIATLWQARIARSERARAERRFNDVRALANSLMFDINDSIQNLAGSTPARQLLVTKALQYLDSLSQEARGDPSLQRELVSAYEKVGDLQGDPFSANLGDTGGALASYQKALAIRESLAALEGGSLDSQKSLAGDYQKLGSGLLASGEYKAALNYAEKVFAIQQRLATAVPGPESQERLAGAYYQRALCQADLADFNGALLDFQRAAAIREAIANAGPGLSAHVRVRLAGTYGLMAMVLAHRGDFEQPIAVARKASNILAKLCESEPTNAMYREYLDETYYYQGTFFEDKGDLGEANRQYRRALAGFESLASADPKEMRGRRFIGKCQRHIGTTLVSSGEVAQGIEKVREGLAIAEDLYRMDPSEKADKLTDLADAYSAVGFAYSRAAALPNPSMGARFAHWKEA